MTKRNERGIGTVLACVLAGLGLVLVIVGGYAIKYYTADTRGAIDQNEKTRADGNYRIAAYDQFFNDCAAVQAKELQIDQLFGTAVSDSWNQGMKDAAITAQQNTRISLITQYNADARKADTRGHFRASDLPFEIPVALYDPEAGNYTSCTA